MRRVLSMLLFIPILLLACLGILIVPAFADVVDSAVATAIDLKPILDVALQLAAAVLLGFGGWVIRWLLLKLRLDADAQVRAYLTQALEAGVNMGIGKVSGAAGKLHKVEIRNQVTAEALRYVVERVPGAIEHFGLTPAVVAQMIAARLPNPPAPAESAK